MLKITDLEINEMGEYSFQVIFARDVKADIKDGFMKNKDPLIRNEGHQSNGASL